MNSKGYYKHVVSESIVAMTTDSIIYPQRFIADAEIETELRTASAVIGSVTGSHLRKLAETYVVLSKNNRSVLESTVDINEVCPGDNFESFYVHCWKQYYLASIYELP